MINDFNEEEYESSIEEKDSGREINFIDKIYNHNPTENFSDKFTSNNKIIKIPYYVYQIVILKSGEFIVASNSSVILFDKNYKIKFKKADVTNNWIHDMCLIDQNTFAVCSSGDIIILEIMKNDFKIIKEYINPHDDHWVNSIIFSKNNILISSSIYDEKVKIWNCFNQSTQPIQ